jgi:DNA-binding transcriptional MerR regulator
MIDGEMTIGEAAKKSGVKIATIRYYEQIGLMPPMPRTQSNRRLYSSAEVRRLTFIRHSRELGFSLEAIAALLKLQAIPEQSCNQADRLAKTHLEDIEQQIQNLEFLRQEIARMLEGCKHESVAQCRVLEVLKDHKLCLREHPPQARHELQAR